MATEVARSSDLQVLFNLLADAKRTVRISLPLLDLDVLEYNPGRGTASRAIRRDQFDKQRDRYAPTDERLNRDLMSWGDVRDAATTSGLAQYLNSVELRTQLGTIAKEAREANRPRPIYLAFDTNMLYHRFATRFLPKEWSRDANAVRHVISKGVDEELDRAVSWKYQPRDADGLAQKAANPGLARRFVNLAHRHARLAKAGLTDARWIRKGLQATEVPAEALGADKEANDRIIAASYAKFAQANHADVVLATADSDMQTHAESARLRCIYAQMGPLTQLPEGFLDERLVCNFIHDLAISAGAITLGGAGVTVWGDWSGKTPEDWNTGALRLDFSPDSTLREPFFKTVDASAAVLSLGIRA